jgi:predicted nucleic acid-binding protein
MLYLDTSALVKLVITERESRALRRFLDAHAALRWISCSLARTEVLRATHAHGPDTLADARQMLETLQFVHLDAALLDAAGLLKPVTLRSLDAIHLAAALVIASELTALVTYDHRMAAGAAALGLAVVAPA